MLYSSLNFIIVEYHWVVIVILCFISTSQNTSMKTSHVRDSHRDVRQKLDYSFQNVGKDHPSKHNGRTVSITENGDVITTNHLSESPPKILREPPEVPMLNGDPGQNCVYHQSCEVSYDDKQFCS